MGESLEVKRLVLDTSVLIEYIVKKAPYKLKVGKLLEKAAEGKIELFITSITLSEVMYVASKIYEVALLPSPNREALDFILWLKGRVKIIEANEDIAIKAGELKKILHIALPDCYVIAAAEVMNAIPVFKKVEREMKLVLNKLRNLKVKFLNEILI